MKEENQEQREVDCREEAGCPDKRLVLLDDQAVFHEDIEIVDFCMVPDESDKGKDPIEENHIASTSPHCELDSIVRSRLKLADVDLPENDDDDQDNKQKGNDEAIGPSSSCTDRFVLISIDSDFFLYVLLQFMMILDSFYLFLPIIFNVNLPDIFFEFLEFFLKFF